MKTTLFIDKPSTGKWVLYGSILVNAYWLLGGGINVYNAPVTGAVFEILWLPMVMLIFIIPVIALLIVLRKGTDKTLPVIALVLTAITILLMALG